MRERKNIISAWFFGLQPCARNPQGPLPPTDALSGEAGGWRFFGRPDYSSCACNVGTQLSDGKYTSVHLCKLPEGGLQAGGVQVRVWEGRDCSGPTPDEKGVVEAAFVNTMLKGECVELTTTLTDSYLDRRVWA